jgi:succinyl-CoA synthetase beta subunit
VKIHEYQAKAVLAKYGVPVPRGEVAFTPQEVPDIAKRLGTGVVVVKAQIHAGGRGKAGGVKLAKSPEEAGKIASELIGKTLVTYQTGPDGQKVSRLLIEEGLAIDKELYLGLVLDRSTRRIVLMVSKEGGVEIEKVAEEHPEKIHKVFINPAVGLQSFEAQKLCFALGLSGDSVK